MSVIKYPVKVIGYDVIDAEGKEICTTAMSREEWFVSKPLCVEIATIIAHALNEYLEPKGEK